jgi:acetyl esterase
VPDTKRAAPAGFAPPQDIRRHVPVDPHIAALLAVYYESGVPPVHKGTPDAARALYLEETHGARTPEQVVPVGATEERVTAGAEGNLRARVYRPEGRGPFPTVVFFHGGGWVIGDLDTHDNIARSICRGARAVVVSVAYRLAPEHPFPAAADDALAAARWVSRHLGEFGGDGRVAVAGDSAGGNLAAVVAQQLHPGDTALAGQFLIYPAVDAGGDYPSRLEYGQGYFLDREDLDWYVGNYLGGWEHLADPRLSPLHGANLSCLPPTLVLTAECDPLRDEAEAYADALDHAGVLVEVQRRDGMVHGFFDLVDQSPAARTAVEESCARFGDLLRG